MQDRLHARIDHYLNESLIITTRDQLDRKAVHDLRVFCKKLRGMLRLYRREKVSGIAELEAAIASIGKSLGANRDTEVLIGLISAWRVRRSKELLALQQTLLASLPQEQRLPNDVGRLHAAILKAQQQWQRLEIDTDDRFLKKALFRSIEKTQTEGLKVLEKGKPKPLHAWRKHVKYEYYQLDVLPPTTARRRRYRQLKSLGMLLGDIHDLDMLMDFLRKAGKKSAPMIERTQVKRARLLQRVLPMFEKTWLDKTQRTQLLGDLQ